MPFISQFDIISAGEIKAHSCASARRCHPKDASPLILKRNRAVGAAEVSSCTIRRSLESVRATAHSASVMIDR